MWPFTQKKQLSPDKLPVPDRWTLSRSQRDGKPIFVRTHTGYQEFRGVAGFEHQVGIAVPLRHADTEGLPTAIETQDLNAIEDAICSVFEPQCESLLVATITTAGVREFVLYTRNPDEVKRKFRLLGDRISSHKVHLRVQPDKGWDIYSKLI
jgi:hypothetical protein